MDFMVNNMGKQLNCDASSLDYTVAKLTSKYLVQEDFYVIRRERLMGNYDFMQIALK